MGWLPKHHYQQAQLRCVSGNHCDETAEMGISLNMADGSIFRFRLSEFDAANLRIYLAEAAQRLAVKRAQSPSSSGSPSVDGSVVPGQVP